MKKLGKEYFDFLVTVQVDYRNQQMRCVEKKKLVRCEDCIFMKEIREGVLACKKELCLLEIDENDYCSRGKRQDE